MALQSETWHQKSTEPTVRSIRSGLTWLDRQCPLVRRSILPNLSQKEDSTVRLGLSPMDSSSRPFYLASSPSSNGPSAFVKRCEIDPMPCSNCLNLVDPLLSDESSSLRERLEPVFQSKSHAF